MVNSWSWFSNSPSGHGAEAPSGQQVCSKPRCSQLHCRQLHLGFCGDLGHGVRLRQMPDAGFRPQLMSSSVEFDVNYSAENKFEPFEGFLDLSSKLEFEFRWCGNLFCTIPIFACVRCSITHNVIVHVLVLWLVCTHTIPFRMLLCLSTCVYIYVHLCIYLHVHVHVHIHIHIHVRVRVVCVSLCLLFCAVPCRVSRVFARYVLFVVRD